MDDKGEIVISKNNILDRDDVTIIDTEAYAMPSSTYVPDDSHAFLVTLDRTLCWPNFGRCWNDKGELILLEKQKSYKEWLLEFCPPNNVSKCGLIFGVNGVCHTFTNRELLIGENDLDVRKAPKNFVTVAVFGKYGFGLNTLKQLITDSYNQANLKVKFPDNTLETVLKRIDNTLEDETNAWKELIEEYFKVPANDICTTHIDALNKLKELLISLLNEREKIFEDYMTKEMSRTTYEQQLYLLLTNTSSNFINYISEKNYIDLTTKSNAIKNIFDFFNKLFHVVEGQINAVNTEGKMDEELAKKESIN